VTSGVPPVTGSSDPVTLPCSLVADSVEAFWTSVEMCDLNRPDRPRCRRGASDVPVTPTVPAERRHRHIRATHHIPTALTVRPLNKKEVNSTPAAKASIDKEWDRLRRRMDLGLPIVMAVFIAINVSSLIPSRHTSRLPFGALPPG
jgi:hypothetical protein